MLPLIIMPGVNSGKYLFAAAPKLLDARVILLDPPGVGNPPMLNLSIPFTTAQYAREVLRWMDLNNIWQADFLGHSMGGYALQELAHLAPARVGKMVLVSTSAGQPATARDVAAMPGKVKRSFWEFNKLIERDPYEGLKPLFGHYFVTYQPQAYATFVKLRTEHLPGTAVSLSHLTAGGAFSSLRWAHTLDMPTLVLQGDEDILVTEASGRHLAGELPNARYIELHGVGHFPMLEHPDFWHYVKEFLHGDGAGEKIAPAPRESVWARVKRFLRPHG